MSWSIQHTGKAKDIAPAIASAVAAISLSDSGEMETVKHVGELLAQALETFDPERPVEVTASGSMGYKEWTDKTSPFQSFAISVKPIHFTVSS